MDGILKDRDVRTTHCQWGQLSLGRVSSSASPFPGLCVLAEGGEMGWWHLFWVLVRRRDTCGEGCWAVTPPSPLKANHSSSQVAGVAGAPRCPSAQLESGVILASDPLGFGSSRFNSHPGEGMGLVSAPFKRDVSGGEEGTARKCQHLQGFFLAKWLPRERVLQKAQC